MVKIVKPFAGDMVPDEPKSCMACGHDVLIADVMELYESKTWFCEKCDLLMINSRIDWREKQTLPFNVKDGYSIDMSDFAWMKKE